MIVRLRFQYSLKKCKTRVIMLLHAHDARCLNTQSDKDPTQWGSYNPHQFANAMNKEQEENVDFYFQKNFKNKILNLFARKKCKINYAFDTFGGNPFYEKIVKLKSNKIKLR